MAHIPDSLRGGVVQCHSHGSAIPRGEGNDPTGLPQEIWQEIAKNISGFVVAELNLGQIALEVERCAAGVTTKTLPHPGGGIHKIEDVVRVIEEVAHGK